MVLSLFFLVAVSAAFIFTSFGIFFLCYVCLRRRDCRRVPRALTLTEHMASALHRQTMRLDEVRLQMFLAWLQHHCRGVERRRGRDIQLHLKRWLETFEPDHLQSEYQLLASEIAWWREVDEKTLLRCVSKELVERYGSQ